jgi:hypothetical protein
MLPRDQVETFERLVDEIERVPAVRERPLVSAASMASVSMAGESPASIAVSRVRSAASPTLQASYTAPTMFLPAGGYVARRPRYA